MAFKPFGFYRKRHYSIKNNVFFYLKNKTVLLLYVFYLKKILKKYKFFQKSMEILIKIIYNNKIK